MDALLNQILLEPVMIGNGVGFPLMTGEHECVVIGEDLHAALAGL